MNNLLKIIAVVTMICDHIGYIFCPEVEILRIIGRLSLPIFCYFIVQGFSYTRNLKKYIITILIFATISQIPFIIMKRTDLNILFSFALALGILFIRKNIPSYGILAYILIPLAYILNIEYSVYAVGLVIIFYECQSKKLPCLIAIMLATITYTIDINDYKQIIAPLALILIWYIPNIKLKINKYIFYAIYPLQWLVLLSIRLMV